MNVYPTSRYAATGTYPDCFRYVGDSPHCTAPEMDAELHRYRVLTGRLPAFAITAAFSFDPRGTFAWPFHLMEVMRERGVVPDVTLWPHGDGCLDQILSGSQDADLRARARELAAWGGPVVLRFGTEVTLSFYPWSAANNGGWGLTGSVDDVQWPVGPAKYVHAYRRVHDIFRAEGVQAAWLWQTLAEFNGNPFNYPVWYYPGDAYVDWIGMSLFRDHVGGLWGTFQSGYDESKRQLAFVWDRKWKYAEIMCQEKAGDPNFKADFWADCFNGLGEVKVVGVWDAHSATVPAGPRPAGPPVKFDPRPGTEATVPAEAGIDSSPASLAAYRAGLELEWYAERLRTA